MGIGQNFRFLTFNGYVSQHLRTATTGIIGWVGLLVPHIARLLVGANFIRLLPTSLLLGASFLLLTDTLARTIAPIELPLGILTSACGAPFFLYLLVRGQK